MVQTISACAEDEFTCANGRCILNIDKCDNWNDCYDNSDEEDCESQCMYENRDVIFIFQ